MKKKVFRERHNETDIVAELSEKFKPIVKAIVDSKKYVKPKIAKELKKKSDK